MRNFEERKAEVFRRSEKRIKERKQRRNHILMACIPLVLCLTIFGAFLFPGVIPESPREPGSTEAAMGGLTENKSESIACPIAKITVSGRGFSQSYTDVSDVLQISDQLYSYSTRGPDGNSATGNSTTGNGAAGEDYKENADDVSGSIADSANSGYTITLVMNEGNKTEYYLVGSTLKNLTTNQTHTLSQKQVNELEDLLGIPHQ